ncbi:MAG: ABC transporter ATP-binding protein [Candidatus Pacebacteria bacterium]|nr:ABC transporter ATP-binding protein [Candidatus Paceibacterota bacterium]
MPSPIVELRNIHKSYLIGPRRLEVLKGVSLTIHRGDYVAIMGPSGSGKSSLLNILGLLDVLDAGQYMLDGEDVSRLEDVELARHRNTKIGFVFQTFNLFPQYDVLGNIEVPMVYHSRPRHERPDRARELAERVGLGQRFDHKPNQLSGGEMQRTAIARALANDPQIILADEPTGNLDEKTGKGILTIFDELVDNGRTVIFVTHAPEYRKHVKRVMTIHDGMLLC